jgi:hypothetical protein
LFINIWNILAILILNSINWFLPGSYTSTYEFCTCSMEDKSAPKKFERTAIILLSTTFLIYIFINIR